MTLDQFVNKYNGKGVDFDHAYGFQCMDLFHYYELEVLGIDTLDLLTAPTAYKAYLKGNSHYDKINYRPGLIPLAGDVVFWNTSVGSSGHVAIFLDGNDRNFTSFDQNWPVGTKCHKQPHDYKGVAGWLRYNQLTEEEMEQLDKIQSQVNTLTQEVNDLKQKKLKLKPVYKQTNKYKNGKLFYPYGGGYRQLKVAKIQPFRKWLGYQDAIESRAIKKSEIK